MDNEIIPTSPSKEFEDIKRVDDNGIEYWIARELMPLLEYSRWENFFEVIGKAANACMNSNQDVDNHFRKSTKMVKIGSNAARPIDDYKLDRYACYLIAQNSDSSKKAVAKAQTYFAVQTRRQEILGKLSDEEKRLYIRNQVTDNNKKLFKTAQGAGVSHFGLFNDAGYRGLYGMGLSKVEEQKGIEKGELLDRAGTTELAANLFRITQTDEKIKKENVKGEQSAARTHNMVGGKVRQTIKDIGGSLPEDLPTERHIKEIKKEVKELNKHIDKKIGSQE